jgi:hypothetical protein
MEWIVGRSPEDVLKYNVCKQLFSDINPFRMMVSFEIFVYGKDDILKF